MSGPGTAVTGPATPGLTQQVMPPQRHTLDIITTPAGLAALKPEWDELFARAALPQQVFQSHSFLAHWARHYLGKTTTLHIIAARREGRLVMLWPLVKRRRFGFTVLQFMGAPVAQFGDVLVDPEHADADLGAAAWAAAEQSGADLFFAQKVRVDSMFLTRLPAHRPIVVDRLQAPFSRLADRVDADAPGSAYPPKERSAYRRRLRRLAEQGEIALRSTLPGEGAAALARQAVDFKLDWLKRHAILSPTLSDPRFSAFFESCAGDPASSLRISTIERGNRPIAIDLSFDCKGSSFGHVIASDPDCEREGVGSVLIHHVFAAAKARGSTVFDMLAPADPYKLRHADGETDTRDLAYVFTSSGHLYCEAVLKRARPLVRDLARRLPAGLVRRIGP